jgi:hypothetical protein
MDLRRVFPKLTPQNHAIVSPPTDEYNCIAFAARDHSLWWWPDRAGLSYWPSSAAREESIAAFQQAYAALGFEPCANADLEFGFEKVAIYAIGGTPTHAARQLPNGRWVSKLGELEDIEHASLDVLAGAVYGDVAAILRRPVT